MCGNPERLEMQPFATETSYFHCIRCNHQQARNIDQDLENRDHFENSDSYYFSEFSLWLSAKVATRRVRIMQKHLQTGSIVEVGPGSGQVIEASVNQGFKVAAVEGSSAFANILRSRFKADIYQGMFEEISFDEEKFDAVLSFHVIEHVPSPQEHLRKALEITKPGGWLFLATPNSDSWDHALCRSKWTGFSTGHVHLFSKSSIAASLQEAGWETENVGTLEFPWQLLWSLKVAVKPKKPTRETAGKNLEHIPLRLGATMLSIFAFVTWPVRALQEMCKGGGELFIAARKPR